MKKLIIFGSSEIAELAKFYFESENKSEVVAFTIDDEFISEDSFKGLPIVPYSEITKSFPAEDYNMHVALSYKKLNKLREKKYKQAKNSGYFLESFISKNAYISKKSKTFENRGNPILLHDSKWRFPRNLNFPESISVILRLIRESEPRLWPLRSVFLGKFFV